MHFAGFRPVHAISTVYYLIIQQLQCRYEGSEKFLRSYFKLSYAKSICFIFFQYKATAILFG